MAHGARPVCSYTQICADRLRQRSGTQSGHLCRGHVGLPAGIEKVRFEDGFGQEKCQIWWLGGDQVRTTKSQILKKKSTSGNCGYVHIWLQLSICWNCLLMKSKSKLTMPTDNENKLHMPLTLYHHGAQLNIYHSMPNAQEAFMHCWYLSQVPHVSWDLRSHSRLAFLSHWNK